MFCHNAWLSQIACVVIRMFEVRFSGRKVLGLLLVVSALFSAKLAFAANPLYTLAASLDAPTPSTARPAFKLQLPDAGFERELKIADLGFAEGAELGALGGTQTFYFPIARAARYTGATLNLAYEAATPLAGQRSLLVLVGERVVASRKLLAGSDAQRISVALRAEDLRGDFVKLSVRYSGLLGDQRCFDARRANDSLRILPDSSLQLNVAKESLSQVQNVLALMPSRVAIGMPERVLSEAESAAVIAAIRLFRQRGQQIEVLPLAQLFAKPAATSGSWRRGVVAVANAADLRSLQSTAALPATAPANVSSWLFADGPGLLLSGSDPQLATNFLAARWAGAGEGRAFTVVHNQRSALQGERISFDQLGIASPVLDVAEQQSWSVRINARDLPAGRWPVALDLDIGMGADGHAQPAVANVFLNGRYLDGRIAAREGITHIHASIPRGLIGLDNELRVVLQRQPTGGDCRELSPAYPAQVLGSSSLQLSESATPDADFFSLAPHASEQLTVYLRDSLPLASQAQALRSIGLAAAQLSSAAAPLQVKRVSAAQIDKLPAAFIAWGDFDFSRNTPPLRLDQGKVLLATREGRELFKLEPGQSSLLAQVISVSGQAAGVWLHASGASADWPQPEAIDLDRGNVAFINQGGVATALSTERERLIEVRYPEAHSWLDWLERYRAWLVVAAWLLLTLVVLMALRRMYARKQPHDQA
ncbi:hypothetical protein GCM10028811_32810 [Uliginosibacterium sediminicola]